MRYRLMATYRGVPYEAGIGPTDEDVVLFAACPPPEELGFEPATGHWRKQLRIKDVQGLWESRPMGTFRGGPCIVLDDLGDRLHIAYLGHDAYQAEKLGYWEVDRGVFELITPREEVSEIVEERLDYPHRRPAQDPLAEPPAAGPPAAEAADVAAAATATPAPAAVAAASNHHAASGPRTAESYLTGPHAALPQANEIHLTGPHAARPPVAEIELTGPHAARISVTGPHVVRPPAAEPTLTGPHAARPPAPAPPGPATDGLPAAVPPAAVPPAAVPPATGLPAAVPPAAGPPAAVPPATGPLTTGPLTTGPLTTGPLTTGRPVTGAHAARPGPGSDFAPAPPAAEPALPLEAAARRAALARGAQPAEPPGPVPGPGPAPGPEPESRSATRVHSRPESRRGPGPESSRRRRSEPRRDATQRVFSELAGLAAIPPSAYAVGEEIEGAMCLIQTPDGFEVFNAAAGARHEVRIFDDEESAYFYLFGVLAAEAVRTGRLAPQG
jgi:hypothetical protein